MQVFINQSSPPPEAIDLHKITFKTLILKEYREIAVGGMCQCNNIAIGWEIGGYPIRKMLVTKTKLPTKLF